jgi:ElaB/YqjD/DUF883 family membrane-anchored ribosome-binding protein
MASTKEAAASIEDIQHELQKLRDDLARLGEQMTGVLSATGDDALGKMKGRLHRMGKDFDEAVSGASDRGREALGDISDNVSEALESSLREHPLTTVALALGLGFLFGFAWRR